MHTSLAACPSGLTPRHTPPSLFELHYALHAVDDQTVLWLSDARSGNLAEAWVQVGQGGPLAVGAGPARALVSPLEVEARGWPVIRDPGTGPRLDWRRRDDASAVLVTEDDRLAHATLFARVDELLEHLGAPALTEAARGVLIADAPEGALRHIALERTRRLWRLHLDVRGGDERIRTTWVANDRSSWRTDWAF